MMVRILLLPVLFAATLYAASAEFNTNGTDYEMAATHHTRLDPATNAHISVGYLQNDDEFDTRQKMLYADAVAISKRPYDHWTFGLGGRLINTEINHAAGDASAVILAAGAHAFFHVPVQRKLYLALSYYYAPSFLVFSDTFDGYDAIRLELDISVSKTLKAYVGGRNIRLHHDKAGSYEFANSGFIGLQYFF
jgi:hypothetical protein